MLPYIAPPPGVGKYGSGIGGPLLKIRACFLKLAWQSLLILNHWRWYVQHLPGRLEDWQWHHQFEQILVWFHPAITPLAAQGPAKLRPFGL
jgi:hypothetical protein